MSTGSRKRKSNLFIHYLVPIDMKGGNLRSTLEPEIRLENHSLHGATEKLRHSFAACRVKFKWFGTSRSLSAEQKSIAAESFGAAGDSIRAGKKLVDTRHEAFRAMTSLRSRITGFWKGNSLPYPEPGVRLIKHDQIVAFDQALVDYRAELERATQNLSDHYEELRGLARERLGSLFNADDYPSSLAGEFDLQWDFPSIEPPDYLRHLNPQLYEQECQRVQNRFDEAVQLAEQAFLDELSGLVQHLADRLKGDVDGKPRIFRDSALENFTEFFGRFQSLNIRSNEQLDQLVERARNILRGVEPDQLRSSTSLREQLSSQLASVQTSLDGLLIDRPRRNIQRRPR